MKINSCTGRIDLHMHTTVSNGTDRPEEIIGKVKDAGITVFSVTDHDAVKAAEIIPALLTDDDPRFIPGAEFSCRDEYGKYHILAYGFNPFSEGIRRVVFLGHSLRVKKVTARLDFLKTAFGFTFTEEELSGLMAMDNPGKPHIGNLMVEHGYAPDRKTAIKDYIDKLNLDSMTVRPEQVIEGITAGGGIPVLAHPFYGSGDELIVGEEMENRLKRLMGFGLMGVEAYYSGFTDKLICEMLSLAEKNGLFVTAGSDYHGGNKMIALGDTGLADLGEAPNGMRRFLNKTL